MKIAVIGTGYVGLVAGACFADSGNNVWCVDKDASKIDALKRGEIPIYEPGLESLVERGVAHENLHFTTSTADGVRDAEIVFLAVGTPSLPSGEPDLQFLKAASEEVARAMTGYCLVVNKSTVPIGAHEVVANWMRPHASHSFDVVSNPEFLKEGSAVEDFLKPDRVVIGTRNDAAFKKMAILYAPFVRQGNPIIEMDPVSAEITKYACNSFLATRISFMNELSALCEKVGGNIEDVRKGMSTDARIGHRFLYAGVGYGGSCFPKDVRALLAKGREHGVPLGIVEAAEAANERQKKHILKAIRAEFRDSLKDKVFAVWGLSFKPNTDDMRDAPSLVIVDELLKAGAKVRAYDPVAMENAKKALENRVAFCPSRYDAVEGADALVLVTEWNEFRQPDFLLLKEKMRRPVIFDGRNVYLPDQVRGFGFAYHGIGRGQGARA